MEQKPKRQFAVALNRGLLGLTRHWIRVVLIVLGLYAGLPWVAPVMMQVGWTGVGQVLYTLYSPFCHQFAFRSVFLFGDQPFYPRYNTGSYFTPYETYVQNLPDFAPTRVMPIFGPVGDVYGYAPGYQIASREFVGNAQMGYKTAMCARDVSIYGAMFFGALIYSIPVVRRRLRPCPLWLYVLLGLAPIGIDGFSQLFGYPPLGLWPARETVPEFRVLTGALFGLMNAWLGFPYLEMSMQEYREELEEKFRRAGIAV